MNSDAPGRPIFTPINASLHEPKSDHNNNSYYSLGFNSDDLCRLIDNCNSIQRKPRASESSTIYDTCSSNSSTSSTTYNSTTPIYSNANIKYKPIVDLSPTTSTLNPIELNCFDSSGKALNGQCLPKEQPTEDIELNTCAPPTKTSTTAVSVINETERCDYSSKDIGVLGTASGKISKYRARKLKRMGLFTPASLVASPNGCTKPFNDGIDLRPILNQYFSVVYTCMHPYCGFEASLRSELIEHSRVKHMCEEIFDEMETLPSKIAKMSYKCLFNRSMCGKKLDTVNKIASHICKNHLNKTEIQFENSSVLSHEDQIDKTPPQVLFNNIFICSYNECLMSFQTEKALKLHKLTHKCQQNLQQTQNFTKDSFCSKDMLIQVEPEKPHSCHICGSKFVRPSHLKSHMKSHIGFKCDYCSEVFPKHSILLSHVFDAHKLTDKIYKCHYENCNKSYLCRMYLSSHITKSHLKQPPTELDKQCLECNTKFNSVWLKRQHDEQEHDRKTEIVRSYTCAHEGCNKIFTSSSKLHRHSLAHAKVKQFKCEYPDCEAQFGRQDHLVNHIKFHEDQKLYECDYENCASTFKYHNNLITHKKVYHGIKADPDVTTNKKRPTRKQIYEEFKPIIQLSDTEEENTNVSNDNIVNRNIESSKLEEFKCMSCLFTFNSEEELNIHLKSHFDVHNASQKINEYLIAEKRKNQEDLSMVDDEIIESPNTDGSKYIQENDMTLHSCENLQCDSFNKIGIPDQKFIIQLNKDEDDYTETFKYNHVININSDDEENVMCSVIVENLSGSARTDYKSNHIYIEKYRSKRKNGNQFQTLDNKRLKLYSETDVDVYERPVSSQSSLSSVIFSPNGEQNTKPSITSVSCSNKKSRVKSDIKRKPYKRKPNLPKSQSLSFQIDMSAFQDSLIPQTSMNC